MGCVADDRDKHAWPPVQNMTRHRYVRPLRRNLLGREAPRRLCDRHARQISSMLLLRCCAQEKMFPDTHEQNSACRWVCLCVNFDISRRASAAASVYERKNPLRESASRVRFASAPLEGCGRAKGSVRPCGPCDRVCSARCGPQAGAPTGAAFACAVACTVAGCRCWPCCTVANKSKF